MLFSVVSYQVDLCLIDLHQRAYLYSEAKKNHKKTTTTGTVQLAEGGHRVHISKGEKKESGSGPNQMIRVILCTVNNSTVSSHFLIWGAVVLATAGLLAPSLRTGTLDVGILERGGSRDCGVS